MIFPGSWTARGAQLVDDLSHALDLQRSCRLDDDRGASMPTQGGAALPPEPAGAQRQGIATLATTCC